MANTLIDTCAWLSFFDERENAERRDDIDAIYQLVEGHTIAVPWPIVYETVRTRLARNHIALAKMEIALKAPRIEWISDEPYRQRALEMAFDEGIRRRRPLSMADCLIRALIEDINVKLDYLLTWNARDFADICAARRVEIIDID